MTTYLCRPTPAGPSFVDRSSDLVDHHSMGPKTAIPIIGRHADSPLFRAFRRARGPIAASAVTYVTFLLLGIALASSSWAFAVNQRDSVVNGAQTSPIQAEDRQGNHLTAALLDFGANAALGAIPTSIIGLTVVGPFPIAAYRGWVGGIVSIDSSHHSRLATPSGAIYYIVTIILQLIGYVLTTGAGVHVGLSAWKIRNDTSVPSHAGFRVPTSALRDAGYIYMVAVPVFLIGSLWEFFA
jgi:hypothetical protein